MKQEQLLEAIGGIDEGLLHESEKMPAARGKLLRRVCLAAAIIGAFALTAAASSGLFSRPIEGSEIITDETVAPFSMDSDGNIIMEGVQGLKVTMDVELNQDAPQALEEFYVLDMGKEWTELGGGGAMDGFFYSYHFTEWKKGDLPGRIRLSQEIAYYYEAGVNGENCVDTLPKLTAEDGVTAQTTTFAGISVLKVTIPALPRYADNPSIDSYYCVDGETRLYWTDGDYILMFAYPEWMSEKEAEKIMLSLEKEAYVDPRPDGYGTVDPQAIAQRLPDLSIGTETGTTCANNTMGLGRFAYSDGYIYCGDAGCIYRYDTATGQVTEFTLADQFAGPGEMFTTDNYICYVDTWSDLIAMSKDGATETPVFQGLHSSKLYAEGNTLYCVGGIIDLTTGKITSWPAGVHDYYVDAHYVYALQEDANYFLRAPKDTMEFEKIPVSFYPISIFADGEDIYMTMGGAKKTWSVIRYRDGQEEELPIRALEYQVFDGKLIYRDETEGGRAIKSYDLETGQTQVLQAEGFNFSILEERYVCILCADSEGHAYSVILDWETGETATIDIYK